MDHLDRLRIFVAVGDEGGFALAARRLGVSAPSVTRAIAALEERIGARLVHRTTRVVRLTDAGARFLVDARRVLDELADAEALAAGDRVEVRGTLGVTASRLFGQRWVSPVILDFLRAHPTVRLRVSFVDRVVDLAEEGLDVAVRIANLPDSGLLTTRVGEVRRVVCASPSWLAANGTPTDPADLAEAEAIVFSQQATEQDWRFRGTLVRPRGRLVVDSAELAISAAVAGLGVVRPLSYQVVDEVARGELVPLLVAHEPPALPVHVVHRDGRLASARVRAFVDLAVVRLRACRWDLAVSRSR